MRRVIFLTESGLVVRTTQVTMQCQEAAFEGSLIHLDLLLAAAPVGVG